MIDLVDGKPRWVVNKHCNGATIHDRRCPHVDETMHTTPMLRLATRTHVEEMHRVLPRIKFCRRCAKRTLD